MARTDRVVRMYLRDTFLVTTKTGGTFRGLLADADDKTLLLVNATALGADGSETPADGQLFLPRSDVAYMQRA